MEEEHSQSEAAGDGPAPPHDVSSYLGNLTGTENLPRMPLVSEQHHVTEGGGGTQLVDGLHQNLEQYQNRSSHISAPIPDRNQTKAQFYSLMASLSPRRPPAAPFVRAAAATPPRSPQPEQSMMGQRERRAYSGAAASRCVLTC